MHTLLALPCVLLGAFGYRLRGSSYFHALTGLGDTYARLLAYGATMGLTALAAGAPYWLALGLIPVVGLMAGAVGNFGAIDMGHNDGTWLSDFLWSTLHGFILVAPAAVLGAVASQVQGLPPARWLYLVAGGLLMGVVYALTWLLPPRAVAPPTFLANEVEYAELAFGLVLNLGLAAVFLAP